MKEKLFIIKEKNYRLKPDHWQRDMALGGEDEST